jgi:hypothetical protein
LIGALGAAERRALRIVKKETGNGGSQGGAGKGPAGKDVFQSSSWRVESIAMGSRRYDSVRARVARGSVVVAINNVVAAHRPVGKAVVGNRARHARRLRDEVFNGRSHAAWNGSRVRDGRALGSGEVRRQQASAPVHGVLGEERRESRRARLAWAQDVDGARRRGPAAARLARLRAGGGTQRAEERKDMQDTRHPQEVATRGRFDVRERENWMMTIFAHVSASGQPAEEA